MLGTPHGVAFPLECAEDRCPRALQLVNFRGEDEVAFGQTVDLVRPGGDLCLPPSQKNVGVMSLLFGDLAHLIHKLKRLAKIRESKCPGDVMRIQHLPMWQLLRELFEFFPCEGRNASLAWHTSLVRKCGHGIFPSSK